MVSITATCTGAQDGTTCYQDGTLERAPKSQRQSLLDVSTKKREIGHRVIGAKIMSARITQEVIMNNIKDYVYILMLVLLWWLGDTLVWLMD